MDESTVYQVPLLPHSVTIGRGANGNISLEVKVYGKTPSDALGEAKACFDALESSYPAKGK